MADRVLVFYGSYRSDRMGIRLADHIVAGLMARGDDVELIDAKAIGLPMLDRMYKEYAPGSAPQREVRLSPNEFRLLLFFMQNPGRVLSRDELFNSVWGSQIPVAGRTVDVHIARLRRALKWKGRRDPIRTVRGVGYVLGDSAASVRPVPSAVGRLEGGLALASRTPAVGTAILGPADALGPTADVGQSGIELDRARKRARRFGRDLKTGG